VEIALTMQLFFRKAEKITLLIWRREEMPVTIEKEEKRNSEAYG
jgi:hypothetical protein